MTIDEWSKCPNCGSAALLSEIRILAENSGECPMCTKPLNPLDLVLEPNPQQALEKWLGTELKEENATN
jgi:RNA polymerase subunit RPABC4/transcription elongation factor Spt4